MFSASIVGKAAEVNSLIADQLTIGKITSELKTGVFTINATVDKAVDVDASAKVAEDGKSFTQRIKLNGSGTADSRSIHFKVTGNSEVTVYAMSGSSSAERKLSLYNSVDGTLIDEMAAPGATLNNKKFTVRAGDYYLASPASGVNVYGVIIETKGFAPFTLDASKLAIEKISASKEVNGFKIAATAAKAVDVDASVMVATDGTSFTQRIKLNGSGTVDSRSIHFKATESAEVTVYAMSGSSSAERKLSLYSIDGTFVDEMAAPGATLNMKKFTVVAGDYYLASPSSGVNVYGITVAPVGGNTEVKRLDWAQVKAPVITDVQVDGKNMNVKFTLVTGNDGADKATVTMSDSTGQVVNSVMVGTSAEETKTATFTPATSGSYTFKVEAFRNNVEAGKESTTFTKKFSLPLVQPVIYALNNGDNGFTVKWNAIKEAESYLVEYRTVGETAFNTATTVTTTEAVLKGLKVGTKYELRVTAIRGTDKATSEVLTKVLKAAQERDWAFTYFGQSASSSVNKMEMIDPDAFTFSLKSCTVKDDGVTIDGKGGKFTTFHDGISYYYTKVNPNTENFKLTATFKLDYINSTPDGQEGFGLLAMDSLGEYGVASKNHYTNSAAVIATKFETTMDGTKYASKDTLGARFVSGITQEVLAAGDTGIATSGKNVSNAFSYAAEDLVKTGGSYTLTLKKTNTGYHASINGGKEFIMYGADKLLQLDKDNIYVGFAVARGCNVTVSDVSFTTSNPATDAPAEKEPAQLVSYSTKIDSPTTTSKSDYKFVYVPSVPGTLTVKDASGKAVIENEKLSEKVDFTKDLKLEEGKNVFIVAFTPNADYVPGENQLLESYETVTTEFTVEYRAYAGSTVYVAPNGNQSGNGTKESPLDIYTATQFARNGQVIELAGGTYEMTQSLIIARGNDGSENSHRVLKSADGERAVLNFAKAPGGMQVWGNYWLIHNIDVTETPGNIKGLQIAGNNNIISGVNAYKNGDTGIQISGTGLETIEKWPSYNLILNCTSYDNCDPGMNNADGFAAKITCGVGNIFRGCIAHHNLDDGWDLFSKIESGPIGAVTIEDCIAYSNGTLTNGLGNGDGNGFKLGGDGIAVKHKIVNSIAYNNNHAGITSNSDPAIIVENCTSYANKGANITLYGKGSGVKSFVVKNVISIGGAVEDNISEMPSLASNDNYVWNGAVSVNAAGQKVDATIFVSTDVTIAPTRDKNGSILMNGLLVLNDKAPKGIGGVLKATVLEFNETPVQYNDSTKVNTETGNVVDNLVKTENEVDTLVKTGSVVDTQLIIILGLLLITIGAGVILAKKKFNSNI
jgi:hypothetical protein